MIDVVSDLHLDFRREIPRFEPRSNVLVVAGDLAECRHPNWLAGMKTLTRLWRDVIYVAGNHEYYGLSTRDIDRYRAHGIKNLHWLENEAVVVDGQRYLGATGWFPDRPNNVLYQRGLSDFRAIRDFVPWVHEQNRVSREFLAQATAEDVVVTHHLPNDRCVHKMWAGSQLNRFFVGDLDGRPKLWIFGHTHNPTDFVHDGVRYVCNPWGYPGELVDSSILTVDV